MMSFIWDKVPSYVKWPMAFAFFLFLVPLKIRDELSGFVQKEVHAYVIPMKEKRDLEIIQMRNDLNDIKKSTYRIESILMKDK